MSFTIRPANLADLHPLVALAAETFPDSAPAGSAVENIDLHIATNLNEDVFAGYLQNPDAVLLIAEDGGTLLGYTLTFLGEQNAADVASLLSVRPTAELSKFYVLAAARGAGLSAALMEKTLSAAAQRGAHGIWLGVSSVNERAKRFYAKHGFERIGGKKFMFGQIEEFDDVLQRRLETQPGAHSMQVVIRERTAADIPAVLAVMANCARVDGYFAGPNGELEAHAEEAVVEPAFTHAWVAEVSDDAGTRLAGHIAVMRLQDTEDASYIPIWTSVTGAPTDSHLLLKRLFVDPAVQGQAIGRKLMAQALKHIEQQGKIPLLDTVNTAEAGMHLYQKLGWREVGRAPAKWSDDPRVEAVMFVPPGY